MNEDDPVTDFSTEKLGRLVRSIDEQGIPRRLPVSEWWDVLARLLASRVEAGRDWPRSLKERVGGMARAALRFSRPDGSLTFGPPGAVDGRASLIRTLSEVLDDPGMATVSRWWFGRSGGSSTGSSPPLPAFGSDTTPLAMMRADWAKTGDILAVDARDRTMQRVELTVGGQPLIGPTWPGAEGQARPRLWVTSSTADCAEWSSGVGSDRVTRTAVLLRGRGIALLAEQRATAAGSVASRLALSPGVVARPVPDSRVLLLKPGAGGAAVRVVPVALPHDGGGSFAEDGGMLALTAPADAGRRAWLPLLFSWDKSRERKAARWRLLTVSENGHACPPDRAFAARVFWGSGESLLIYRSLAKAATRTFLGHQTSSRMLIGLFSAEGNVTPLLKVD
jgi:hypothetical protein